MRNKKSKSSYNSTIISTSHDHYQRLVVGRKIGSRSVGIFNKRLKAQSPFIMAFESIIEKKTIESTNDINDRYADIV